MAADYKVGLSRPAREEVDASIARSALGLERLISAGRILFYGAILVRFASLDAQVSGRLITLLPLVVGILFSAYVLAWVKTPPKGTALWMVSVTLDALAVHTALSENALWPRPGYAGILHMPDSMGILLATVGAGLRLSLPVALVGGLMNLLGVFVLVSIDGAVSGLGVHNQALHLSIYLIFVGASALLAVIFAYGTRHIVARAAAAALRAEHAEHGLGTVLADCHDARSLLTSVRLGAELVGRRTDQPDHPESQRLRLARDCLLEDLRSVEELILGVSSRALSDLSVLSPPAPVPLAASVERVLRPLRLRFDHVVFAVDDVPDELDVLVGGGERALDRVLLNLLTNACEGDGKQGARNVTVQAEACTDPHWIELRVVDDGPGLASPAPETSTKTGGLGVGLRVVRGIIEASGGSVAVQRRDGGGTVLRARLPRASQEPAAVAEPRNTGG
jgi:signal transduction histidine kinase